MREREREEEEEEEEEEEVESFFFFFNFLGGINIVYFLELNTQLALCLVVLRRVGPTKSTKIE